MRVTAPPLVQLMLFTDVADIPRSQGIKKSEAAKKQRDLKKFGKQIQVEKLKQREVDKKSFAERMHGIKRSERACFPRHSSADRYQSGKMEWILAKRRMEMNLRSMWTTLLRGDHHAEVSGAKQFVEAEEIRR